MANANPAEAMDASVLWFNPAGMTNLSGNQTVLGAGYLIFNGDFDNDPTRSISSGGAPVTGGDGGAFGVDSPVPSFYAALELDTPMPAYMGIGINAPFGLATNYDYGWVGRYNALESTLLNFNINPAVAFALNDFISIGAGVNIQYSTVTLSQAIDTGVFLGAPAADDSMLTMEADGFAPGYNFGVMLYPSDRFRMGVSYRSSLSLDYDGTADFDLSASGEGVSSATGALVDTGITSHVDLPDALSVHAFYQATEKFALMSDVTWTNWSKVQSIPITFDNPNQPADALVLEYHDTIRVSLGASYDVTDDLTLRFGAAFDATPQPDETRGFRVPDANQWIVGAGANWSPRPWLNVGLGYTFFYLEEADIDVSTPTGAADTFNRRGQPGHTHICSFWKAASNSSRRHGVRRSGPTRAEHPHSDAGSCRWSEAEDDRYGAAVRTPILRRRSYPAPWSFSVRTAPGWIITTATSLGLRSRASETPAAFKAAALMR